MLNSITNVTAVTLVPEVVIITVYVALHVKKAIPLQAWTGPEGSRSLKLSDFKTVTI